MRDLKADMLINYKRLATHGKIHTWAKSIRGGNRTRKYFVAQHVRNIETYSLINMAINIQHFAENFSQTKNLKVDHCKHGKEI